MEKYIRDEERGSTVNEIRKETITGKKFHDIVAEKFVSQYDATRTLEIPEGYAFSNLPKAYAAICGTVNTYAFSGRFR